MNNEFKFCTDSIHSKYPFTFVDIGAMGGIPHNWDPVLNAIKVVAFEPDEREFAKLRGTDQITYLNYALYREPQELTFYLTRKSGASSIYKPNTSVLSQFQDLERFDIVKEEVFPKERVKTLDAVIEENNILDVDFVKIDTQGSEFQILEGCQQAVLPKAFGLNIEVEFIELYQGQALFRDIDRFMDEHGFQLMDIRRHYWKRKDHYDFSGKGQLVFGDALYFKKISQFYEELKLHCHAKEICVSKIYKSILSCLVYRLYDYAISLINHGFSHQYFSEQEYQSLKRSIIQYSQRGSIPDFKGKGKLSGLANAINQKLQTSHLGWADSDRYIGNVRDK